jgi:hypothetical protein
MSDDQGAFSTRRRPAPDSGTTLRGAAWLTVLAATWLLVTNLVYYARLVDRFWAQAGSLLGLPNGSSGG